MLREFFCGDKRIFAWLGLLVFVGHQLFAAWMKWRLNLWYEAFYDVLQTAGAELGSGDAASGASDVTAQLFDFVRIVLPSVAVHPLAGLVKHWWVLEWRMALITNYTRAWDAQHVEGAAQRVHEDTQRFASGIHSCVALVLNAVLTLIVFCPVLYGLMPVLMAAAVLFAGGGLAAAAALGHRLVQLEVNNQRVEAALRKDLVLLECTPASFGGSVSILFAAHMHSIKRNYRRLYLNFSCLAVWLAAYEQAAVLVPYAVAAPLLFAAPPQRISLGMLVKMANAFGKTFDAFNVVADNWILVNDWRSTLVRLREFESAVYDQRAPLRELAETAPRARLAD